MARRTRRTKNISSEGFSKRSKKILNCRECGSKVIVDENSVGVICASCVFKMGGPPPSFAKMQTEKSEKPKGWTFMAEFVDKDGNVFHKGVEVPELKGTLKPTDVASIKKEQKERSIERKKHKAEREKKKEEKMVKEYEKKKKMQKKEKEKKEKELANLSNGNLSKFI